MPKTPEKYSLEKAQEEAAKLRAKIKSGEAQSYKEAEALLEIGKSKEKVPAKERSQKLLAEAMKEYDNLGGSAKMLEILDKEFSSDLRNAASAFRSRATEGNPKELGYRQVAKMAEEVTHAVRSDLLKLEELQGESLPIVSRAQGDVESLLSAVGKESDPQAALQKAKIAVDMFQKVVERLRSGREEKHRCRKRIDVAIDENGRKARTEFLRAEVTLNQKMDGSVLDTYQRESRRLAKAVEDISGKLKAADRKFIEENDKRRVRFSQLVLELAGSSQ